MELYCWAAHADINQRGGQQKGSFSLLYLAVFRISRLDQIPSEHEPPPRPRLISLIEEYIPSVATAASEVEF